MEVQNKEMERTIAFRQAGNTADFALLAVLADEIWREHYIPIIGLAQVDYMLHRFQSAEAIEQQVGAGMVYILITSGAIPAGYLAYENRGDCLAAIGDDERASDDYTKIIVHTSSINPKRLSVARSMLMPATPLDFLTRKE